MRQRAISIANVAAAHPKTLPISICNETRTPFYFRAYDAACNALAEALADLLTRDRRLAASAGHRARVAVV